MRIQYASDLHLETVGNEPYSSIVVPTAQILILAGDICPVENPAYVSFLRWCSQNWEFIVVVAGNHEYFCQHVPRTIPEIDGEIHKHVNQFSNVVFLQNSDSIVINGIRFVGTTLWSKVDSGLWNSPELLKKGDYTHTGVPPGRVSTPADIVALHTQQKMDLESVVAASKEPLVVITHHLPTYNLVSPEFKHHPLLSTYVSDVEYMIVPKVRAWICGHSHKSQYWRSPNGTVCTLNPRGYAGQNKQFLKGAVIDLSV